MRAGLAICREHGQPLSWWLELDTADQAVYLADQRLRVQEAGRHRRSR
jgi:hypothetical protein